MAVREEEIAPGQVYLTTDYLFVQVVALAPKAVVYRVRRASPLRYFLPSSKRSPIASFAASIRAEVNGEYLPDFADLTNYAFHRPAYQGVALSRYLRERAPHRPFVTSCDAAAGVPDAPRYDQI